MTLHTFPAPFPPATMPDLVEPSAVFKALLAARGKVEPNGRTPARARAAQSMIDEDSDYAERGRINVAVARDDREVEEAIGLVRERYQWRGYSADHVKPAKHDPSRRGFTLVARDGQSTVVPCRWDSTAPGDC